MSRTSLVRYCCLNPSMRPFSLTPLMKSSMNCSQVTYLTRLCGSVDEDLVGDRLDQVGLAEAGVGVDEDGVVGRTGRLGDAAGDRRGVLVVGADDPALEGVAWIEPGGVGRGAVAVAHRGAADRRRGRRRRHTVAAAVGRHLGGALVDDQAHLDVGGHDGAQGLTQDVAETRLDPVAGELVGQPDDERAFIQSHGDGALEPEAEGGVVHAPPDLVASLVPDECQLLVDRALALLLDALRRSRRTPHKERADSSHHWAAGRQKSDSRRPIPSSVRARLPSPRECTKPISSSKCSSR